MGQNGRLTRIQVSTDGGSTYANVAGVREDGMSLTTELLDGTTKDDAGWKTSVDDVALKSMSLSCSGLTQASDTTLEDWWDGVGAGSTLMLMKFIRPSGKTYTGSFGMPSFEIGAPDGDSATFSASFESSGVVTVTAT